MGKLTNLNNLVKLSEALDVRYKELIDEEKARALAEEQALKAEITDITNNIITEAKLDLLLEEIFGINSKNELTSVRLGNYQMKYNNVNDTLDFLYNGAIDEPTKETVSLTWVVGNLDSSGAEIVQDNTLRSDFVAIEDNYIYSFYLGTTMSDPTGVRVYFYDTNKAFISRTNGDALGYTTGTDILLDIPSNAAYMRFKANVDGTTTLNNINTLLTLTKANDEIVIPTWNDGKSLTSDGSIVDNETAMITELIQIDENYNYTISYANVSEVRIISYDINEAIISRSEYLTSGSVDTLIEFPENTAYFRIKAEKVGITVNEANDNIIIKKVKKVGGYVTEGLSMYIDANDVATYGSIRDITGKQNITNHGVSTTLDNGCLNFVSSESDYLDTGLVPNLTTWSTEVYFYYTSSPTETQAVYSWGDSNSNRVRLGYTSSGNIMKLVTNSSQGDMGAIDNYLTLCHIVFTANNGTFIVYINGIKQYEFTGKAYSSHTGTLKIGTGINASEDFANMNLRMFRHYDGKVLSDEEVLQNYNYELNRDDNIIKPTWTNNMKLDSDTGLEAAAVKNACSNFISYDNSYNYTLAIDAVTFFRVYYYDSSQSYISNDSIDDNFKGIITPPQNTEYIRLKLNKGTAEFADLNNHVILRKTLK